MNIASGLAVKRDELLAVELELDDQDGAGAARPGLSDSASDVIRSAPDRNRTCARGLGNRCSIH